MTRADIPSAHAEALTRKALDLVSWWTKSPCPSLSSMKRSAVAASGTRSSASASTISARPSLVDSANSRTAAEPVVIAPDRVDEPRGGPVDPAVLVGAEPRRFEQPGGDDAIVGG